MGKPTGFLEIERQDRPYEKAEARLKHWQEFVHAAAAGRGLPSRRARCMDCGIPFCHNGCPVNNLIPDWNDLVYRDQWQDGARASCTRPTTSRSSPAASAPRPARRPARSTSTTTR